MSEWVTQNEVAVRLVFFLGVFGWMALWEVAAPRRVLRVAKFGRWLANLGIVVLNTLFLRIVFPAASVGIAWMAAARGFGLFANLAWPSWLELILSVVALDFAIYIQHVLFHAIPALWRLHMMHHADLDLDVTTGTRFHPIEMLLSAFIKMAIVVGLGPPPLAVLSFEVLLNATSMFNHSNIRLPSAADRILRRLIVTPDMHRVHHSVNPAETNSNFGFNLPWWDRLLGTYRGQPEAGHEGMTVGLAQFRDPERLTLPWMLALPFIGQTGNYPLSSDL